MTADVLSTTVNYNGRTMYKGSYSPGYCPYGYGMMPMAGSCFDFGFCDFGSYVGTNVGFAAGYALAPQLPAIGKAVWTGMCKFGGAVANGAKNLWNKIFHKAPKEKAAEA